MMGPAAHAPQPILSSYSKNEKGPPGRGYDRDYPREYRGDPRCRGMPLGGRIVNGLPAANRPVLPRSGTWEEMARRPGEKKHKHLHQTDHTMIISACASNA